MIKRLNKRLVRGNRVECVAAHFRTCLSSALFLFALVFVTGCRDSTEVSQAEKQVATQKETDASLSDSTFAKQSDDHAVGARHEDRGEPDALQSSKGSKGSDVDETPAAEIATREPSVDSQQDSADDSLDEYWEDEIYADEYGDRLVVDSELPEIGASWIRLDPRDEIWMDMENKHVIVGGRIALRRGPLEMFACPAYTKEHESVVAVHGSAFKVHAALLAVGAIPGAPAKVYPEYEPAIGTRIEIDVTWLEDGKPKTVDAKSMVLNSETRKTLPIDWVFGGSVQEEDPHTGDMLYGGNAGMLVCVSNFTISTLDLPFASTDLQDNHMFEANTELVPGRGTRVLLTLKPDLSSYPPRGQDNKESVSTDEIGEQVKADADK
ncbi:MAG TPA: YdjY domain-containing protein [Pirellulaceae bacterium]|nr:YdjY domain-containing protein [Pirellulaceae bacterium]HMO92727.1 YdjY domain-containing protein [Pirellulaceae bacterium]HMP70279.1 YdjY domain-containing protein [Pirellulaceae bacterium]